MQAKSNDIVVGFDLIASLINVISNVRVNIDFLFGKWYKHSLELAQKVSVDETKPRVCSKQTDRENHSADSIADYYKISLAIPLIDIVLSELKRRFEGNQTFIFSGLYIIPYIMASSPNWRDHFKDFLKFYKDDFENTSLSTVDGELQLWEQHWKNSKAALPDSVSETLKRINFPCFPIIKTALRILGTVPVTSCACERSFPSMKLLKTYSRSNMTNDRLNAFATLNVHLDLHPTSEDALHKCMAIGPHRLDFDI